MPATGPVPAPGPAGEGDSGEGPGLLRPPPLVRLLVAVTGLQVAGMVVFALGTVLAALRGSATSVAGVALLSLIALGWAGGLAVATSAVARGRRAGRAPVVLTELILLLAVGVPLVQGSSPLVGWLLVGTALPALIAVLSPPVTASLH